MNQCKGGSLASLINGKRVLTDKEVALIMKGILSGLNFIHMMGYLHRDIKPENILFARENDLTSIQISDFGLGAKYDQYFSLEQNLKCGTLLFMAPEQANSNIYSTNVDVWACGIIAYILVTGEHPLCNDIHMKAERLLNILSKPVFMYPHSINPLAKSFIAKSCEFNPEIRYSCLDCLNHPWITRNADEQVQPSYASKLKTSIEVDKLESIVKSFLFLSRIMQKAAKSKLELKKQNSSMLPQMDNSSGDDNERDSIKELASVCSRGSNRKLERNASSLTLAQSNKLVQCARKYPGYSSTNILSPNVEKKLVSPNKNFSSTSRSKIGFRYLPINSDNFQKFHKNVCSNKIALHPIVAMYQKTKSNTIHLPKINSFPAITSSK